MRAFCVPDALTHATPVWPNEPILICDFQGRPALLWGSLSSRDPSWGHCLPVGLTFSRMLGTKAWLTTFSMCFHTSLLWELSVPMWMHWEGTLEAWCSLSWSISLCLFPVLILLSIFHYHQSQLSHFLNLSRESLSLRVAVGSPPQPACGRWSIYFWMSLKNILVFSEVALFQILFFLGCKRASSLYFPLLLTSRITWNDSIICLISLCSSK